VILLEMEAAPLLAAIPSWNIGDARETDMRRLCHEEGVRCGDGDGDKV